MILALDLGIRTGFATATESGVVEHRLERGESPGMRFIRFRGWLGEMLDTLKPAVVVYEMPHMRGGAAASLLIGMATRVEEECAARKIEYAKVHSATLKKFATGSGRGDKTAMLKRAEAMAGRKMTDDNEADAFLALMWAEARFGKGRAA